MFDQSMLLNLLLNLAIFSVTGAFLYPWIEKKFFGKEISLRQGLMWGVMTSLLFTLLKSF